MSRIGWLYQDTYLLEWEVVGYDDELEAWKMVPHGPFCAPWRLVREFTLDSEYQRI